MAGEGGIISRLDAEVVEETGEVEVMGDTDASGEVAPEEIALPAGAEKPPAGKGMAPAGVPAAATSFLEVVLL